MPVEPANPAISCEDKNLRITYKSPSDFITGEHRQWLIDEFTDLDNRIYSGDKENCTWAEKIDLTDLAKFVIVNQLVDNYESFHGSGKIYRDNADHAAKNGTDTKWHFGPVWDCGSSFNRDMRSMLFEGEVWYNHWIEAMYGFPAFKAEIERVYAGFMDGDYNRIYDYIDNCAANIAVAVAADKERWPQYGNENMPDHATSVKNKLRESVRFLNKEFNYGGEVVEPVEIYLRGHNYNQWAVNAQNRFSTADNRIYTLHVDELSGEFKIATSDWRIDLGTADDPCIRLGVETLMADNGGNCTVEGSSVANAILTLNLPAKTLTITDPNHSGIETTGIESAVITARDGILTIISPCAASIRVYTIDGISISLDLMEGCNTFSLPRGFYIINGNKYTL